MRERMSTELQRLQGELSKGFQERKALLQQVQKLETQIVSIQGAIQALTNLLKSAEEEEEEVCDE
jgi:septal ring factor EnvC (AmiA/AmiB activator)